MLSEYLAYRYGKRKTQKAIEREFEKLNNTFENTDICPDYPHDLGLVNQLYWLFTGRSL